MAAIKLFGATIAVECPVREDHDHDHEHEHGRVMSKVTMMTMATTSSSSSSSDQGAAVERTKKPDKTIPCPRCKSMETKFCYFNNYNVNQPRHFCKGCQRYWTAGGALRNVPVGAGRRKSKPPTPTPHQLCRETGDGMHVDGDLGYGLVYDDGGEDWRLVEQGSLPLQQIVGIKRRRTDFHTDHDQCY